MSSTATTTVSNFNQIKPDYPERSILKGIRNSVLTDEDARLIRTFVAEMQSARDIGLKRAHKLTYTLVGWRRFIGPFRQNDITAVYLGIAALKSGTSLKEKPFSANSIRDHLLTLKQFYLWLVENELVDIPHKKVKALKVPNPNTMTKVASDLLTVDEITAMLHACEQSRDRALITMLYEGGFRIGEIGVMRWGDIQFDRFGVVVNVMFKTNKPRYIRLVMSREHLATWKNDYPFQPITNEMPVFVTERKSPLSYGSAFMQIKRIAQRANLKKHVTPHLFRHSRITHLIRDGVSESVIKLMMWGNLTTDMFQTYAHLTGTDIDREILSTYGISAESQAIANVRLEPRQCEHCKTINSPISNFCSLCGRPLDEKGAVSHEDIKEWFMEHPEEIKQYFETRTKKKP
jgi:site-specific recombinase XerD